MVQFRRLHFQMHLPEWKSVCFDLNMKYIPKGPIDNNPALVPIMTWHQTGDKQLSEPMMA